jgi:hypothetical protein
VQIPQKRKARSTGHCVAFATDVNSRSSMTCLRLKHFCV